MLALKNSSFIGIFLTRKINGKGPNSEKEGGCDDMNHIFCEELKNFLHYLFPGHVLQQ